MDQDTLNYLNNMEKHLEGLIAAMGKSLEDKIESFIQQSKESHRTIDTTHQNFRADIKQIYGRVELNEKTIIQVESRVKALEDAKGAGRWRWEIAVAFGSILIAIAAIFFGG